MKTLKPILDKKEYSSMIEVVIMEFLTTYFYAPIYSVIEPIEEYYNSANLTLTEAIRSGQIQYINGKFSGQFDAKISKELESLGAKFNKVTKTYNIEKTLLSVQIREAIAYATIIAIARQKLLLEALNFLNIETAMPELNKLLQVPLDTMLEDLDDQAYLSLKDAIAIVPVITEEQREALKEQYFEDVSISVKNFTEKQTNKLREMVEHNLLVGLYDNKPLVKAIIDEFGVTENKARFLARNETGLFTATFKMITYKEAGITHYKWSTSHDDRVRKFHKDLDGQIIAWDNPPIVNDKGDRKHAGFDYQCRCEMLGIIDNML